MTTDTAYTVELIQKGLTLFDRPYLTKAKSPDARIGNLNTSCPENFKVYRLVRTEDNTYTKIETEIFNRLWDVRHYTKQGEPTEFLHC